MEVRFDISVIKELIDWLTLLLQVTNQDATWVETAGRGDNRSEYILDR